MLISHRLRHLVASFSLVLVCLVTQAPAFARTQEANFIRLGSETAADNPASVRGDMLLANDGNIYFASFAGGTDGLGFIGKLTPDGTFSTLYKFATADEGAKPYAGVIQGSDGALYGTTFLGGVQGAGTVFRLTLDGQYTVLRSLGESPVDASLPYTGVVQAGDGNLYGTTLRGGANDMGTIFRISPTGSDFAIIHNFEGSDGENPEGRLVVGADGGLYGTTLQGGGDNRGTAYRISTGGTFVSLYSFPSLSAFTNGLAVNATGANPRAGMMLSADGNFYGTTYQGGTNGFGTVFRMTPAGAVSVLHAFTGASTGGGFPLAGVVQDAAGNFYGTTVYGGYLDQGSAWRIDASGEFKLLHGFVDLGTDGANPYAGLLLAHDTIYGVSFTDFLLGLGGIFKLDDGSNGALPVELSATPTEIVRGSNVILTWSSPTALTCTTTGAWTVVDIATAGTLTVTPTIPGIYNYGLRCTDGAGVARNAYAAIVVNTPPLETVDGGGGTGSLPVSLLLLLAVLLLTRIPRRLS